MTSILFVDDDFDVLEALRRNLGAARECWNLDFVTSADHALAKIETKNIDIVVTDVLMPSMRGDRLVYEIVEKFPNTLEPVAKLHHYTDVSSLTF